MTCTTCGRENPPHLTFCQECGQRLGPRIAPPTPPIGLGVEAGMPEAPPYRAPSADLYPQQAPAPSRLATSLGSGPSPVTDAAIAQALHAQAQSRPPQAQAQPGGGERNCRVCATPNGPNLRYCTSCGSTLDAQAAPQAAAIAQAPRLVEAGPAAPMPLQHAPSPLAPAPAPFAATALAPSSAGTPAPIAPMRVVDLGGVSRPSSDGPKMCARCRGVVDAAAQFCKFCGAPLAEPAASPAPSPGIGPSGASPPAPAAPMTPPERLDLPRANGGPPRPPTVPMNAVSPNLADPPTPYAAPPAPPPVTPPPPIAAAPAHAPAPAPAHAPAPAPAHAHAQSRPPVPAQAPAAPAPAAPPVVRAAVTRGRLVVIAKSGADGPSYPIGDTLDVGRSEGQIIVGEDPYLSPRHVRIAWTGTKLVLRDLASTNGVFIRLVAARDMSAGKQGQKASANDDKVPGEVAVPLHDQDLILVGQQVLRFESIKDGEVGFGPATEHGTLLFGSPAAPRYARLSQRTVEGVTRDVYYVRKVETVLGRESGDVVFTEDPFLSRRHAAIRVLGRDGAPLRQEKGAKPPIDALEGVQFALVDLGSSNGSFLRIRSELDLVPGDHFRVGQQLFRVDFETESSHASRGRTG